VVSVTYGSHLGFQNHDNCSTFIAWKLNCMVTAATIDSIFCYLGQTFDGTLRKSNMAAFKNFKN
jgi:hypothetical protein